MTHQLSHYKISDNDSLTEIRRKIKVLVNHLDLLECVRMIVASRQENTLKVYTNNEVSALKTMVENLLNSTVDVSPSQDVCKILLKLRDALMDPCSKKIEVLRAAADHVIGHGSAWLKVGTIVLAIVGLLCGILPGLFFLSYFAPDFWAQGSRHGLSQLVVKASDVISNTGTFLNRNQNSVLTIKTHSFYEQNQKLVDDIPDQPPVGETQPGKPADKTPSGDEEYQEEVFVIKTTRV